MHNFVTFGLKILNFLKTKVDAHALISKFTGLKFRKLFHANA